MTQEVPEVLYCTAKDGTRIAYSVEGEGPPLLFCHYVYSFSLSHRLPNYEETIKRLGEGRQLIRYDLRGTGLSQREVDDLSPAADVSDIAAIVDAMEMERFFILGATAGGARAIEYAATYPDQVGGLVLYESFPCLLDVYPRQLLQAFAHLSRTDWELATHSLSDVAIRQLDAEEEIQWARLINDSVTGDTMARMIEASMELDVSELLNRVQCPTLVCHSRNDPLWPFELGARLAAGIPNARFVPLEGDRNGPFTEPEAALGVISGFLDELQSSREYSAEVAAIPQKALTPRETEVLRLIAAGMTSKEISQHLSLSIRTVGRHITNIYDKIGARGRADATAYALRQGLAEE